MRTASMRCARSSKNFTQLIGPTLVLNKQKSGNDPFVICFQALLTSSKRYSPIVEPTLQLAITAQHRNTSPWGEDRSPPVAPKLKKMSYYLTRPPPITTSPQAASNTRVEPSPIS
ncbi:hypothetical protein JI435_406450 [Parastagonospora nodorum SN15]|uniref:Uncharacterized protein n=1 Tax=Phaeosphaeria nodorum (strain SN15 / ATCC MYA-4574 / FGSC 10173) TaxID=321614 RepID=A0A7U2EXN4_PHANO|nr:hypothetical protein JI435_406450 [Parastagonospora nodorum SN15]